MLGLDRVMSGGLMESIEWFFDLVSIVNSQVAWNNARQHDKNKDGFLTKDEVIHLSESLLVRYYLLGGAMTEPPSVYLSE